MVKVFISGLTAAGKTTHAKLLASDYHLQYMSASNILLERAHIDTTNLPKNFWVSSAASTLRSQRSQDQSIDIWVDQQMIAAATSANNVVFDSWGLPWLSTEPGLRIWLESSTLSRWWKAIVSQGLDSQTNPGETLAEMSKKDDFTREYFLSTYGFDLFQDHEIFDYILDITTFISAPTHEASNLSISKVHNLITDIVKYHMDQDSNNLSKLHKHIKIYSKNIFLKIHPDVSLNNTEQEI